jgi:hypothetical protein
VRKRKRERGGRGREREREGHRGRGRDTERDRDRDRDRERQQMIDGKIYKQKTNKRKSKSVTKRYNAASQMIITYIQHAIRTDKT